MWISADDAHRWFYKLVQSHSFQPQCRALPAANAKRNECPLRGATLQFFEAAQDQSRAGRADGMPQRNRPAIYVEAVFRQLAENARTAQGGAGEFVRAEAFEH